MLFYNQADTDSPFGSSNRRFKLIYAWLGSVGFFS
ncbi:hypothetical protein ES319_D01G181400v1 [Gossypium barbadense]|uniref:Uncharacterized protein n=2 Tax=Gossypium TaxID=3633 RepID=A0A5J5SQM3_GOSBA|nr:hypothetical protein ES319_D01G181400v1 [Gossypium barbadense]TYG83786.1 hypothetical protein ES288_D01G195400v1 [Gossypium darwinii]